MLKRTSIVLIVCFLFAGCEILENIFQKGLTEEEAADGVREALRVGALNAGNRLSQEGGYFESADVFIPFPPEIATVGDALRQAGFDRQVSRFVKTMNHAAEEAAGTSYSIFRNTITGMSVRDALNIVNGHESAATEYLKANSYDELQRKYNSLVRVKMRELEVVGMWEQLSGHYNSLPFLDPIDFDLTEYVTSRALDGLFLRIEEEEHKIRTDPSARTSEILRRVFGYF